MRAIAWAIVWVAIWYSPEVSRATRGEDLPQGALAVWLGMLLFATVVLLSATFAGW